MAITTESGPDVARCRQGTVERRLTGGNPPGQPALAGVLDFGDLFAGDPACDLAGKPTWEPAGYAALDRSVRHL